MVGQGEEHPGRSGEEQGLAGWPGAAAGAAEEEWEEEECPAGSRMVTGEAEGEEGEAAEEECWSCGLLSGLETGVCCRKNLNWNWRREERKKRRS